MYWWLNPKVSIKVQFDTLYIFSKASSSLHIGFREFNRHFKLLQPLEFYILAKFTKRPVRKNFFLSGKKSNWKTSKKNKSCENLCAGYNNFASRRFRYSKGSKKLIKGQCPLRDMATAWELKIKSRFPENLSVWYYFDYNDIIFDSENWKTPSSQFLIFRAQK